MNNCGIIINLRGTQAEQKYLIELSEKAGYKSIGAWIRTIAGLPGNKIEKELFERWMRDTERGPDFQDYFKKILQNSMVSPITIGRKVEVMKLSFPADLTDFYDYFQIPSKNRKQIQSGTLLVETKNGIVAFFLKPGDSEFKPFAVYYKYLKKRKRI